MSDLLQMEAAASNSLGAVAANSSSSPNLTDAISQMLSANEDRPGFMYEDVSIPDPPSVPDPAPVQQQVPVQQQAYQQQAYQQQAYQPQYQQQQQTPQQPPQDLINALQYERARNEQLAEQANMVRAYEEVLAADPVAQQRFLQYFQTGTVDVPQANADPTQPQQPQQATRQQVAYIPPVLRKQLEGLQEEVAYMKLKNEAEELEKNYPNIFQAAPVAQYMAQNGFKSLKDAFHHLLGNSVGELLRNQQQQAYQQQAQAWQAYQQAYQQQAYQQAYQQYQQYVQAHQQAQNQQYQAQYPVTATTPPPSAQDSAVVLRPGAGLMASDPLDNVKPKNWKEAEALMLHDMKKIGFAV
jgi:hypothetical protein